MPFKLYKSTFMEIKLAHVRFSIRLDSFGMSYAVNASYGRRNATMNSLNRAGKMLCYGPNGEELRALVTEIESKLQDKFGEQMVTAEQAFGEDKDVWPYWADKKLNSGEKNQDWLFEDTDDDAVINYIKEVLDSYHGEEFNPSSLPYNPVLIIWKGDGDSYEVAATPAKAYVSFLSKLTQRFNEGWYDYLKQAKNSLEAPRFTKEEVEKLPESFVNKKDEFLKEIEKYERQEKILRQSLEEYKEIQEAVSTSDGRLASQLMRDLESGFEIERPTIL